VVLRIDPESIILSDPCGWNLARRSQSLANVVLGCHYRMVRFLSSFSLLAVPGHNRSIARL
jgi:hypothetical protein